MSLVNILQATCILGHGAVCQRLLQLLVSRDIVFKFILSQHVL